jgi:hypothetical protein
MLALDGVLIYAHKLVMFILLLLPGLAHFICWFVRLSICFLRFDVCIWLLCRVFFYFLFLTFSHIEIYSPDGFLFDQNNKQALNRRWKVRA